MCIRSYTGGDSKWIPRPSEAGYESGHVHILHIPSHGSLSSPSSLFTWSHHHPILSPAPNSDPSLSLFDTTITAFGTLTQLHSAVALGRDRILYYGGIYQTNRFLMLEIRHGGTEESVEMKWREIARHPKRERRLPNLHSMAMVQLGQYVFGVGGKDRGERETGDLYLLDFR